MDEFDEIVISFQEGGFRKREKHKIFISLVVIAFGILIFTAMAFYDLISLFLYLLLLIFSFGAITKCAFDQTIIPNTKTVSIYKSGIEFRFFPEPKRGKERVVLSFQEIKKVKVINPDWPSPSSNCFLQIKLNSSHFYAIHTIYGSPEQYKKIIATFDKFKRS